MAHGERGDGQPGEHRFRPAAEPVGQREAGAQRHPCLQYGPLPEPAAGQHRAVRAMIALSPVVDAYTTARFD